jgi:hypothetical protein
MRTSSTPFHDKLSAGTLVNLNPKIFNLESINSFGLVVSTFTMHDRTGMGYEVLVSGRVYKCARSALLNKIII